MRASAARILRLEELAPRPRTVAIGVFDGVHRGHREVVRDIETVVTFDPHPAAIVDPGNVPVALTTIERKAELLGALGVRELVVIPMDEALVRMSPQAFVDDVLVAALGARHVSVGANFRFGHRAAGDPELLRADGRFTVRVVPVVEAGGAPVSSTRIRSLVCAGAFDEAAALLGDRIAVGMRRGRVDIRMAGARAGS